MGKASVKFLELRFIIDDELTQVYILCQAEGDCPIGVQGWHHKTFPASKNVAQIMDAMFKDGDDPILWSLEGPIEWRR